MRIEFILFLMLFYNVKTLENNPRWSTYLKTSSIFHAKLRYFKYINHPKSRQHIEVHNNLLFSVHAINNGTFTPVTLSATFSVVTQRSSPGKKRCVTLRDDTKNGCVADYHSLSLKLWQPLYIAFSLASLSIYTNLLQQKKALIYKKSSRLERWG